MKGKTVQLFSTLSRKFETLDPRAVGLYCCGPTVYSSAHLGNLRTYIFEDILVRTLRYAGFAVNHVMNITDVGHLVSDADDGEDKMALAVRCWKNVNGLVAKGIGHTRMKSGRG